MVPSFASLSPKQFWRALVLPGRGPRVFSGSLLGCALLMGVVFGGGCAHSCRSGEEAGLTGVASSAVPRCSPSSGSELGPELQVPPPGLKAPFRVQWGRKLDGLVAELALAEQSGDLLISMIPDPENKSATRVRRPVLEFWDASGQKRWRQELKVQSRLIAISRDGDFIAAQSHLEELALLNRAGKKLWSRKTSCRPHFLARADFLLCHHDDAAEPSLAVELLALKDGKVLASYSHRQDPLAVRFAEGQGYFAIAFSGGRVEVFSLDSWLRARTREFRPERALTVAGEITDLAFVGPDLWLLHGATRDESKGKSGAAGSITLPRQTLTRWVRASRGEQVPPAEEEVTRSLVLPRVFRQLEPQKSGVWLYANGAGAQSLLKVEAVPSGDLQISWARTVRGASEFSSQVRDFGGDALLGVEWGAEWGEKGAPTSAGTLPGSALVLVSAAGETRWAMSMTDPEVGGLLYAHAVARGARSRVVAASDTGRVWLLEPQ